ncbi:MAG TPA: hypothetical protein VGB76_18900 [Pyrinomonadaceae bacterium]|jgi:hypothetical protein
MPKELQREFVSAVQYFLMVLVALVAAFFGVFVPASTGGETVSAINIGEAWKNIDPYVKSVLFIFSSLSVVRFLFVFLLYSGKKPLA